MGVKLILSQEADMVTERPVIIPFDFKDVPTGKETGDTITITPITVRTWFQLKPLFTLIDSEDFNSLIDKRDGEFFNEEKNQILSKYDELIFEIVCIGIHNKSGEMPEWYKEVLKSSCTWEDIYILLNAIFFRIQTSSFLKSITALRAVSPLGEEEIIALQQNKRKWNHKAALPSSFQQMKHSDIPTDRR